MITATENRIALNALLTKADPRRADRASDRPMRHAEWTGTAWIGMCDGAGQTYHPRITLVGQRRFNCTCQDKAKNARQAGPCKHVISLARIALERLQGSTSTTAA